MQILPIQLVWLGCVGVHCGLWKIKVTIDIMSPLVYYSYSGLQIG